MTCHKAQGGEWSTVIVDFESNAGARNASFFRWAYTAITRATKKLIVVNPPDFSAMSVMAWAQTAVSPEVAGQDFTTDPDWHRLSFSAATAPLMPTHQQLRMVWGAQGISIEHLQHMQYCERYVLARDGKRASVQYYYDKKYRVGRTGAVPTQQSDSRLADDALTSIYALVGKQGVEHTEPFIQEFLDRLDMALGGSPLQRTGFKSMPYRLRVSFSDSYRKGDIDFTYDGSSTWTAAQEVGGGGSSNGLYEEVQRMMSAGKVEIQ